jgi:hypothetical protein
VLNWSGTFLRHLTENSADVEDEALRIWPGQRQAKQVCMACKNCLGKEGWVLNPCRAATKMSILVLTVEMGGGLGQRMEDTRPDKQLLCPDVLASWALLVLPVRSFFKAEAPFFVLHANLERITANHRDHNLNTRTNLPT